MIDFLSKVFVTVGALASGALIIWAALYLIQLARGLLRR